MFTAFLSPLDFVSDWFLYAHCGIIEYKLGIDYIVRLCKWQIAIVMETANREMDWSWLITWTQYSLINISLYFTMDVRVLDTSDFLAIANHFNYTCSTMFLKFELCVVFPSVSAFVLIQENNTTARVAFWKHSKYWNSNLMGCFCLFAGLVSESPCEMA